MRSTVGRQVAKHLLQCPTRNHRVDFESASLVSMLCYCTVAKSCTRRISPMTLFCTSCSKHTRQFSPHECHVKSCSINRGHPCCFDSRKHTRNGRQPDLYSPIVVSSSPGELESNSHKTNLKAVYHDTTAFSADHPCGVRVTLSCAMQFRQNSDKVCRLTCQRSRRDGPREEVGIADLSIRKVPSGRGYSSTR